MRFSGLWRHPDFMRLWVGGTVSGFGSQITFLALPFTAVLVLDANPLQMGILAAAGSAPSLILGLGVGVWVDRRKKRPIMIATDYGRALLLIAVPIAAAFHVLRIEYLYAIALGVGMLRMFFSIANRSMLPSWCFFLVQRISLSGSLRPPMTELYVIWASPVLVSAKPT